LNQLDEVRVAEILLIEDNPGDVRLTLEALRDTKVGSKLNVVTDGAAALAFLRQEGQYAEAPRPDLILLDLQLPVVHGWRVLEEIKADDSLRRIPVVILAASDAERDILRSYELQANCYISKPADLGRFVEAVQSICRFWLSTVKLSSEQLE
jgi:chemotaxis family two-component system response regulator Rcp1